MILATDMHPTLFEIGAFKPPTYGVVLLFACAAGGLLAIHLAKRAGIDPKTMFDVCLLMGIGAYLGTRAIFLVTKWAVVQDDPSALFTANLGPALYGAILGAVPTFLWAARRWKLPIGTLLDCLAPALALLLSIKGLGCYLGGCCYGAPCVDGVIFPVLQDGIPRYPTQLYEAGFEGFLFALTLWFWFARRWSGQVWWTYLVLYAVGTFGLEFVRGDDRGLEMLWSGGAAPTMPAGLTIAQVLCVLLSLGGVAMLFWPMKRERVDASLASGRIGPTAAALALLLPFLAQGCHIEPVTLATRLVSVSSNPPGAQVMLDGEPQIERLPSGAPRLVDGFSLQLVTPATLPLNCADTDHRLGVRWPDGSEDSVIVSVTRRVRRSTDPESQRRLTTGWWWDPPHVHFTHAPPPGFR